MKWIILIALALAATGCAPEPNVSIVADPDVVHQYDTPYGPRFDSSVITWTSEDVKECSISAPDRGTISTRLEGSATIYWITRTITVTARCINVGVNNGTVSATVAITCSDCGS